MRLSYYGGGHYDSVSPIDDDPYSAASPVEEEGAGVAGPATTGAFYRPASGVIAEAVPEPGQLEEVALERSRKRAAEASGGRWVGGWVVCLFGGWRSGAVFENTKKKEAVLSKSCIKSYPSKLGAQHIYLFIYIYI